MIDIITAGLWAGYGLAVPVGAVAVLMVDMTARTSFRTGAAAAIGASTADGIYAIAAVIGGGALATAITPLSTPLRWAAFAVLAVMAVRILGSALRRRGPDRLNDAAGPISPLRSYVTFLGLTALNPWPAIYFVALILGQQAKGTMAPADSLVYVVAIIAASASWQLLLAGGGAMLGRVLTSARGRTISAAASSVLIIGLAVSMVAGA